MPIPKHHEAADPDAEAVQKHYNELETTLACCGNVDIRVYYSEYVFRKTVRAELYVLALYVSVTATSTELTDTIVRTKGRF